jgi:NAD(P)-dependent dehydrogenase (short-subunit alcohol dehydrogenase family)
MQSKSGSAAALGRVPVATFLWEPNHTGEVEGRHDTRGKSQRPKAELASCSVPVTKQRSWKLVEGFQIIETDFDGLLSTSPIPGEIEKVRTLALSSFGRIDTWVNVAGVDVWGKVTNTPERDARRLFEVNFWGTVHGSLAAIQALGHE